MKNILLIDDDSLIHMSYYMALFGSQYNKISIQDVAEAMQYPKLKDNYVKPDLILVDLMLGACSGTDIIKEMRVDKYFDKIPIILHTGYADALSDGVIVKELNILHVLSKPCTKAELLKCIDTYIDYFENKLIS